MTNLILLLNAALTIKNELDGIPAEERSKEMAYIDAGETLLIYVQERLARKTKSGEITANQQAELARDIQTIRQRVGMPSKAIEGSSEGEEVDEA